MKFSAAGSGNSFVALLIGLLGVMAVKFDCKELLMVSQNRTLYFLLLGWRDIVIRKILTITGCWLKSNVIFVFGILGCRYYGASKSAIYCNLAFDRVVRICRFLLQRWRLWWANLGLSFAHYCCCMDPFGIFHQHYAGRQRLAVLLRGISRWHCRRDQLELNSNRIQVAIKRDFSVRFFLLACLRYH